MSLIDKTFFVGGLLLPNLSGVGVVPESNVENLTWFINTYEPVYCKLVLGKTLYAAYSAGLEEITTAERWQNLQKKLIDINNKLSPIAGYIYYHVERDRLSSTSGIGQVRVKSENSEIVVNTDKMCKAYNSSMEAGISIREWLDENSETYPEYDYTELEELSGMLNNFGL